MYLLKTMHLDLIILSFLKALGLKMHVKHVTNDQIKQQQVSDTVGFTKWKTVSGSSSKVSHCKRICGFHHLCFCASLELRVLLDVICPTSHGGGSTPQLSYEAFLANTKSLHWASSSWRHEYLQQNSWKSVLQWRFIRLTLAATLLKYTENSAHVYRWSLLVFLGI